MKPFCIITAALFGASCALVAPPSPPSPPGPPGPAGCRPQDPPTVAEVQALLGQFGVLVASRRVNETLPLFTADATWWVVGDPARVPFSGERPAAERAASAQRSFEGFAEFRTSTVSAAFTPERSVLEAHLEGTRPDVPAFPLYKQDIALVFTTVRVASCAVKIKSIREYFDLVTLMAYANATGLEP
ncbi:hypothetical protein GGTG_07282 [Gaeumannomyces tritici R3-111a-1]|uniref:SnoaL-like domain-containing protein n=1 Tax=Gaeumannomyces tritici (strain R3-111a-1) TaxID=644352 RepID=J3P185_GAET3|nr:hypothetical protein GGTG_07282 [Gaeumannomyces tritici R3-111a-1]EJT77370.1 hypothetical protein GGTG_07282 [Gaeumannomyces tritici R3-111a-1]